MVRGAVTILVIEEAWLGVPLPNMVTEAAWEAIDASADSRQRG